MRLKANAGDLRDIGKLIDSVVGECIVEIRDDDTALYVEQNNPENTMFLKLEVPSHVFQEVDIDGLYKFGANWSRINDVLGYVGTDIVIIEETENGLLRFSENKTGDDVFEYEMSMINSDAIPSIEIPELEDTEFEFECEVGELKNGTGATSLVGNCFNLIIEDGYVKASEQGDTDKVKKPITEVDGDYDGSSRFNRDFLNNFIKKVNSSMELDVEMGDDYPLVVEGTWFDGIDVLCTLAPRK